MLKEKHVYNALLYVIFPIFYLALMCSLNVDQKIDKPTFMSKSDCESILESNNQKLACKNLKVISYYFL